MRVVHLNKDLESQKERAERRMKKWDEEDRIKAQKKYMKYGSKGKQNQAS